MSKEERLNSLLHMEYDTEVQKEIDRLSESSLQPIENYLTLDEYGIQMPWYTRPCLEWLDKLDLRDKKVFEYGVGHSTYWYKTRGAEIFGIDSNCEWGSFAGVNWTTDKSKYLDSIYEAGRNYDLIVIDGEFRDECTKMALWRIRKGGYIIIDNYKQATADLADWPITEKLIENLKVLYYKEPHHPDWVTIVIHV